MPACFPRSQYEHQPAASSEVPTGTRRSDQVRKPRHYGSSACFRMAPARGPEEDGRISPRRCRFAVWPKNDVDGNHRQTKLPDCSRIVSAAREHLQSVGSPTLLSFDLQENDISPATPSASAAAVWPRQSALSRIVHPSRCKEIARALWRGGAKNRRCRTCFFWVRDRSRETNEVLDGGSRRRTPKRGVSACCGEMTLIGL